ncbi:hypothetical protein ACFC6J_06680 [Enterococcus casseliflavus]|uniref:hypothetical protein n=1 Tax=Enterococcus casseliflavus TaxID=37734 RepID=UPI0035D87D94
MNEIKQEILDLLILNGRKPQSIKSEERVVYLYDALNIVNKEFSKIEQPQLNENQQIVVNDVKQDHENYGIPKFSAIHLAFTTYATGYYRDHLKNDEEFYQVLSTLIVWALEQEAE